MIFMGLGLVHFKKYWLLRVCSDIQTNDSMNFTNFSTGAMPTLISPLRDEEVQPRGNNFHLLLLHGIFVINYVPFEPRYKIGQ